MNKRVANILSYAIPLIIGALLLWLVLKNIRLEEVLALLTGARYVYLIPIIAAMGISHLFRAFRWNLLLATLPEARSRDLRPRLSISLYSVMIGYMINGVTPRFGELARTVNTAAQEKLPFTGVLGTVAADRFVLDPIVLIGGFACIPLYDPGILSRTYSEFIRPVWGFLEPWAPLLIVVFIGLGIGAGFWLYRTRHHRVTGSASKHHILRSKVVALANSFKEGLLTVLSTGRPVAIVVSTAGIWLGYVAIVHFSFYMFQGSDLYVWSVADSWTLLLIGSLGIIIPSPGGLGTYHYVITQSLVLFWGVAFNFAAAFALFTHAAQIIVYTATGFVCLVAQGSTIRSLLSSIESQAGQAEDDPIVVT